MPRVIKHAALVRARCSLTFRCERMGAGASASSKALSAAVSADDAAAVRTTEAPPRELGKALHLAAAKGSLAALKALLQRKEVDVNFEASKVTAMRAAIGAHQVAAVTILLADARITLSATIAKPFRRIAAHERSAERAAPLHFAQKMAKEKADTCYREGVPLLVAAAIAANHRSASYKEGAEAACADIIRALLADSRVTVDHEIGLAALAWCAPNASCVEALLAARERTGVDQAAVDVAVADDNRMSMSAQSWGM